MGRLPDFVIVGAQKAGTTATLNTLVLHPDIGANNPIESDGILSRLTRPLRPNRRVFTEPHFFTYRWDRGLDWYEGLFTSDAAVVGERTPAIMYQDLPRRRLAATLPNARIIALLRHPVRRSFSQWNHYNQTPQAAQWGWVPDESFDQAMDADRADIRTRSAYADQIVALRALYPPDRFHVVVSERIRARRQQEFDRLFEFLGVRPLAVPPIPDGDAHVRAYAQGLDLREAERWSEFYSNDIARVRDLLGDTIPEWDT